jgi:hypothetical protein
MRSLEGSPVDSRVVSRTKKKIKVKKKVVPPRGITKDGRPKKKPGPQRTPEEKIQRELLINNALELRMAGTSYAQIAQALKLANPMSAKRLVDKAISGVQVDAAKEVISMDLARLDEMQMRSMHALRTNGDLNQIHTVLRLMEFRYKLLSVTPETLKEIQGEHGVGARTVNNSTTNNVQIIAAAPETENEFIEKMMRSVGVDPGSKEAKKFLQQKQEADRVRSLPMLEGSANEDNEAVRNAKPIGEEDIVDAELVD